MILHLDCFSGISGDMTLGVLVDLGLPLEVLRDELAKLDLPGYRLEARKDRDGALTGTNLFVHLTNRESVKSKRIHAAPQGSARGAPPSEFEAIPRDHLEPPADHPSTGHTHQIPHTHGNGPDEAHTGQGEDPDARRHGPDDAASDPGQGIHDHPRGTHDHGHGTQGHGHGTQGHGHGTHDPGTADHRRYADIRELIERSPLAPEIQATALRIFERLARAEGKIHGQPPADVTFHEVGALDSIVDIVGVAIGLHHLGVTKVTASPLPLGRGMVRCQHGLLPLPAPATLALLEGCPVYDSGQTRELVTPTGAAIISELTEHFGGIPEMVVHTIGYGLGKRRGDSTPNMLRAVLGRPRSDEVQTRDTASQFPTQAALVLEASIDDMNPQFYPPLIKRLLEAGGHDVTMTPVQMKKGRPGTMVQVVCDPEKRNILLEILLAETTTLGVRFYQAERACLDRAIHTIETDFGPMRIKVASWDNAVWNVMPEFEDCLEAAQRSGIPLKRIHQVVLKAALDQGLGSE